MLMFDGGERQRREMAELRVEVDRLRVFIETRAQAQENLVRAMLAEIGARAGEALEARIEVAARLAIAFAEQGLSQHEAALRALGRRVAELSREAPEPAPISPVEIAAPAVGEYAFGALTREAADCRRIEIRDDREQTFLADLANLPILPGGAARLVAAHVVEFLAGRSLSDVVLPHWRERLAPGGKLVIVTRDGPAWCADLARDAADFQRMQARLNAETPRRPLRALFDFEGLRGLLLAAGFAGVEQASGADRLELKVVAWATP